MDELSDVLKSNQLALPIIENHYIHEMYIKSVNEIIKTHNCPETPINLWSDSNYKKKQE